MRLNSWFFYNIIAEIHIVTIYLINNIYDDELGVITKEKVKTKKPNMYAVVLINDDYTPMEFVIYVLQSIFKKSYEEAKK